MSSKKPKDLLRASVAEYLTFVTATGESSIQSLYADENVWLSQKMMGLLYGVESHTITYHLQKIFTDNELEESSVTRIFRVTADDGKTYNTKHYNLSAIIAHPHTHAVAEFEKYRIVQDRLFQSDFDKFIGSRI